MKVFKMFLISMLCITAQSFANDFDFDSSGNRISSTIKQIVSSDNFEKTWTLWRSLEKEISEYTLALQKEPLEARKNFEDYIFTNTINEKFISPILSMLSVKQELNIWQERLVEKFLFQCEKNENSLSLEIKEKLKKVKDLYAKNGKASYLFLKGGSQNADDLTDFTILNYSFSNLKNSDDSLKLLTEEIFGKIPDVICLEGVFSTEDANLLYTIFKEKYGYFYTDIESNNPNLNSGLFIASKFEIVKPGLHFFQDIPYFDFFLKTQKQTVHLYLVDLQFETEKSSVIKDLLKKLNEENDKSPDLGIVLGNMGTPFKRLEDLKIKNPSFALILENSSAASNFTLKNEVFVLNESSGIFSSVVEWWVKLQNHSPLFLKNGNNSEIESKDLPWYYVGDRDSSGGRAGVDVGVSVSKDDEGNTKAEASVECDYTYKGEDGTSVKGYVETSGSVDTEGKTSGSLEVGIHIDL